MARASYFQTIARRGLTGAKPLRPASAILKRWQQVGEVDYSPATSVKEATAPPQTQSVVSSKAAAPLTEMGVRSERAEPAPTIQPQATRRSETPQAPSREAEQKVVPSVQPAPSLKKSTRRFLEGAAEEPKIEATQPTPTVVTPRKDLPIFDEPILPKPNTRDPQTHDPVTPKSNAIRTESPIAPKTKPPSLSATPVMSQSERVVRETRVEVRDSTVKMVPVAPLPQPPAPKIPPTRTEKHGPTVEIGSIEIRVTKEATPQPQAQAPRVARAAQAPRSSISRGLSSGFGWRQG